LKSSPRRDGRGPQALIRASTGLVAIKVLPRRLAASAAARSAFAREAKAAAAVVTSTSSPSTPSMVAHGLPYLVMQHIPAESLEQRLEPRTLD